MAMQHSITATTTKFTVSARTQCNHSTGTTDSYHSRQQRSIQGTVMDISAGTKQTNSAARLSKWRSMSHLTQACKQWMGYVYQQQAEPTNFTGVTVTLTAIDPNGNFITIGTATTDSTGLYHYTWTPPNVPGNYLVTATFAGTNGYWGSSAETDMTVQGPSATAAPTAAPVSGLATASDLTYGIIAVIIAIIIAIAIVGLLLLRKRAIKTKQQNTTISLSPFLVFKKQWRKE